MTKTGNKCPLCKIDSCSTRPKGSGRKNNKNGQIQNNVSINKNGYHGTEPLLIRRFHFRSGMGMRRGTHSGFICKKASSHTIANSLFHGNSHGSAHNRLRIKCTDQNLHEGLRQLCDVHKDKSQGTENINSCHDRHEFLQNTGKSICSAEEDKSGQSGNDRRYNNRRNMDIQNCKGFRESNTDGVGLHHISHKAKRDNQHYRKKDRQNLSAKSRECRPYIIDRSAGHFSIFLFFIGLGKNRLSIVCRHPEKTRYPHPEDCSGSSAYQSRCRTGERTGTDLRRNCRCNRLECRHLPVFMAASLQRKAAEYHFKTFSQPSKLNKTKLNRIINSRTTEQDN